MTPAAQHKSTGLPVLDRLLDQAGTVDFAPGKKVFYPKAPCRNFLWLVEGSIRVYKRAGMRELTLYHIQSDEPCFTSLCSRLYKLPFNAYGIAETPARALAIDREDFEQALGQSNDLACYLLRVLARRLHTVSALVADIAFEPLELRLACYLGYRFARTSDQALKLTHENIARELGISCLVTSRLLKSFERRGCIRLLHGAIEPVAPNKLPKKIRTK